MAPHAKFFAIYNQPFWRASGLSGTAQSMVGPMVEYFEERGLVYYDDMFELSGNWPEWLRLYAMSS